MEQRYQVGDEVRRVRVEREGEQYRARIDDGDARTLRVTYFGEHTLELHMDGRTVRVHVAREGERRFVAIGSTVYELTAADRTQRRRASSTAEDAGSLQAQMPGQVVAVSARAGETVTKGQTLVILEAMKMELRVQAPHDGVVKRVLVEQGQVVERGQQLVEIAEA